MTAREPSVPPKKRGRPASTPEEREKQLQNKAFDLAEKQLDAGTASSQVISMLIKGGGVREQLELERLRNENRLLNARIDGLESAVRLESLMGEALEAFKTYKGDEPNTSDDEGGE
jgi:hypothetical protein